MLVRGLMVCVRRAPALAVIAILLTCMARPASAAPWWWAEFTIGDAANTVNTNFERWTSFPMAPGFASTASNVDTIYVTSYTWGASDIGTINGIAGFSNAGVDGIYNARSGGAPRNVHVISDNSASWPPGVLIAGPSQNADAVAAITHNKLVLVGNRGLIVSSGNMTSAGTDAQPNNAIWFPWTKNSSLCQAYDAQLYEMSNGAGTFHDNTTVGNNIHYGPTKPDGSKDTVEVYFSPDDQGHISRNGKSSLTTEDVLMQEVARATTSILYISNSMTLGANPGFDGLSDSLQVKAASILVEGATQESNDTSTGNCWYDDLRPSHTSRNGDDFWTSTGDMHHKFIIFDLDIVATGSANHTASAMASTTGNDENEIIIHSPQLARKYVQEWHHVMNRLNLENVGAADAFEEVAPNAPTALTVTPAATSFGLVWTAPANPGDFSRYYIFCSDSPIRVQKDIGDWVDNDADNYYDEDPIGDIDGYKSGSTMADSTSRDDDADGSPDEDPWLYPIQVLKSATPAGVTSTTVTTHDWDDSLVASTNYWFAIVAVDKRGNESILDTAGPYMLGSAAADTKLIVQLNSTIADTNARRGDTRFIAANVFIRGDTVVADTLTIFAVKNLGTSDSLDLTVRLWRDENSDSKITAVDTMLAQLIYSNTTRRYQTTFVATDSRVRLGTAGKTFLITLDVFDTAGLGDTFQAQVDAKTCSSPRRDSGPTTTVTNSGKVTIVSANQVDVVRLGDYPSSAIAKGAVDSPIMRVNFTVGVAGDTLQVFEIRNDGTMTSADVSALRLYEDGNNDSAITAADTLVASLKFVSGSDWRADTIAYRFSGSSVKLIVALSITSGATGGRNFQARVLANSADAIVADTGPTADVTTTALFTIASDTSPDTAIVINEYIVDPSVSDHDNDGVTLDGDEEFLEMYNNSDGFVDVGNWKLDDDFVPGDITLQPASIVMGPRQFLITYADTDPAGNKWYRYNSSGTTILDSGTYIGTWNQYNNSTDSVAIANASNVIIDSQVYGAYTTGKSNERLWDGALTWTTNVTVTPGVNQDPTAAQNNPSPNAHFFVTATPSTVNEGESFTITVTTRNQDDATITAFTSTVVASADTGTLSPTATGALASGTRSESFSVSNMLTTDSVILTFAYNTTTSGTVAITVKNLANITATVILQADSDASGCTGVLSNGIDTYTAVSNAAGTIVFTTVKSATYTLTTKENHHLRRVMTGIVVTGADSTVTVGVHRAGDANNDNRINIFDGAIVKFASLIGTGTAADINRSGGVTSADMQYVRDNFGRAGE